MQYHDILCHIVEVLLRIGASFIPGKQNREHFRKKYALTRTISPENFKWGISYSVFDGIELLESSLRHVRAEADYINIVWSPTSWYGEPMKKDIPGFLESLKQKGIIDEIIRYDTNVHISPRENEKKKRNIGLKAAKRNKCHYYMSMDCDEFFLEGQIRQAKKEIIRSRISHSYCSLLAYSENHTLCDISNPWFIPFFSRINFFSKHCSSKPHACRPDNIRTLTSGIFSKHMVLSGIMMHHFRCTREDMKLKYRNSSMNAEAHKIKEERERERETDYTPSIFAKVPDTFGINELEFIKKKDT